jgi:dTDP-4-amino-4,6-dideoxygalactose transaminase
VTQLPPIPTIRPTLFDRDACYADFAAIWASGRLTSGPFTERLENELARRAGVAAAVCVGSCTSALMLLQRALGLAGEVIIPTFTWTATGTSLLWNNLTPVFVDSRAGDLNIDPDAVEGAITPRTAAICPVAVFGVPADCDRMEEIARRHSVIVYFDSAQAFGAIFHGRTVGGFGVAEVFSFSPTKVATAVEMGAVTTNDVALAMKIRQMRDYGKSTQDEDIVELGLSVRPSEFHAAIGWHSLQHLDEAITHRGRMVARYRERLRGIPGIRFQESTDDRAGSNNYMVIFVGAPCPVTRDELFAGLHQRGVHCKRYFYPCLHQQTVFQRFPFVRSGTLAVAEQAAREGLALPLYGHISESEVDRVIAAVEELLGQRHDLRLSPEKTALS